MSNIKEQRLACTGCSACVDTCPQNALRMAQGKSGFYLPELDESKCVNCGACTRVCPLLSPQKENEKRTYYYGWNNDDSVRVMSSSGGIFSALADAVLSEDGVVFGTVYSRDFKSAVVSSTLERPLGDFRTSKYVQSNPEGSIARIASLLNEGTAVLYAGTPCQIAGARNALKTNTENLILVDFLCGGAAAPQCYSEYISWLEERYGAKVTRVNFRDKRKGWVRSGIGVSFSNGKKYFSLPEYDPYYQYYYGTPYLKNEVCMECAFRTCRAADITIADFWGFRKKGVRHDDKGLSLVVAHTEKGAQLLDSLRESITLIPLKEAEGNYDFIPKKRTAEELSSRVKFLDMVDKENFVSVAYRYKYKHGKFGVAFRKLKKRIKHIFK